jgi:hypothetical protein
MGVLLPRMKAILIDLIEPRKPLMEYVDEVFLDGVFLDSDGELLQLRNMLLDGEGEGGGNDVLDLDEMEIGFVSYGGLRRFSVVFEDRLLAAHQR